MKKYICEYISPIQVCIKVEELKDKLHRKNTQIKELKITNSWFRAFVRIVDKNWTDKQKIEFMKSAIHNSAMGKYA